MVILCSSYQLQFYLFNFLYVHQKSEDLLTTDHGYEGLNPQGLLEMLHLGKLHSRHSDSTNTWLSFLGYTSVVYRMGVSETQVQISLLSPGLISSGESIVNKPYIFTAGLCRLCSTLFCQNCNGYVIIPIQNS